jgi:N-acylneuraminate cytidylyltransferase
VQDANLKIALTQIFATHRSTSGDVILPFISNGHEGFDINHEEVWILSDHYVQSGEVMLPEITINAYLFCACSKKFIS